MSPKAKSYRFMLVHNSSMWKMIFIKLYCWWLLLEGKMFYDLLWCLFFLESKRRSKRRGSCSICVCCCKMMKRQTVLSLVCSNSFCMSMYLLLDVCGGCVNVSVIKACGWRVFFHSCLSLWFPLRKAWLWNTVWQKKYFVLFI